MGMHWFRRSYTLTRKTRQKKRHFNVDFDSYELFVLFLYLREVPSIQKRKKVLVRKFFGSTHTRNRIYLLRNCFSKYVYLKDMQIALNEIGNILFVSVLRILLIFKFLNFMAVFIKKKLTFQSLHTIFRVRKLISV